MMKLWGRLSSINVQKAVWALDEAGAAYERIDAGGAFGIVQTPDYELLNPNRLVPTLEDDGFALWESNAIVRYVAARYSEAGLWPATAQARADADRWMDWQATTATPAMRDAFWQLVRLKKDERDSGTIAKSVEASERIAVILDGAVAGKPYLAGDTFSVADIALGAHAHRWLNLPIDRPALPALEAWYGRIRPRPGARQALILPLT